MKILKGELVATSAELVAAPAVLEVTVGPLSRVPAVRASKADEIAVAEFFDQARAPVAALYRAALTTLADPVRIGALHYGLGEERVSRALLAWGPATGEDAVMMIGLPEGWGIRRVTADTIVDTIASVLLEDTPLSPARLKLALSQDAALVFLAALHALRAGRFRALLAHDLAPVAVTHEVIAEALSDVAEDDFRWPLLFLDKLLPFSLNGVPWDKQIGPALVELADRGLLERVKKAKEAWMLTPLGYQLAVADAQHLTKLGLKITASTDKALKAHETFFFLRSLQDVVMYDLGGREAAIASVPFADIRTLMSTVLTPPASALTPKPAADKGTCGTCGEKLAPGAKFCPGCGSKVMAGAGKASCPSCGAALSPGAKFCATCGTPV